jgi:hypothetical protein
MTDRRRSVARRVVRPQKRGQGTRPHPPFSFCRFLVQARLIAFASADLARPRTHSSAEAHEHSRCRRGNRSPLYFWTPGYVPRENVPVTFPRAPSVSACIVPELSHPATVPSTFLFQAPPTCRFPLPVGHYWRVTLPPANWSPVSIESLNPKPWSDYTSQNLVANSKT